jgi:transcriptional regulator with XRE-family HTH domain
MELRKIFGGRLRTLRKTKGFSQEELAEKADIHPTYIGVIERGEQAPTLDTVEKIAKALDIKISELFLFSTKIDKIDELRTEIIALLGNKNIKTLRLVSKIIKDIVEWTEEK